MFGRLTLFIFALSLAGAPAFGQPAPRWAVPEGCSHHERCGAGADAGDALAVFLRGHLRQQLADIVAIVRGDALQAADGDGFFFNATAPAGGFAGPIANATENAGEYVGFTVDEIRLREVPLCNEPDVFGNVGMGWTGPLAVHYAMIVIRISGIGRFHRYWAPYLRK